MQLGQLRLILEGIEEKNSTFVGQAQAGGYLGRTGLLDFAFGLQFFVEFDGFRSKFAVLAALLKLVGCIPVDQGFRNLLPLAALRAVIADAVAVNLVLSDGLIRAVLEDEALGLILGESLRQTKEGQYRGCCREKHCAARE